MEFNPHNPIVQLCIQGMRLEEEREHEGSGELFLRAWNEAKDDFEKFIAAYSVGRYRKDPRDQLRWFETALSFARNTDDIAVKSALPSLYLRISECYRSLGDIDKAGKTEEVAASFTSKPSDAGPFYHGTRAGLRVGDVLTAGKRSNYKSDVIMNHVYFTASLRGAGLAAALAKGDGRERVYQVEPTGPFENDPNVTDKRFPGNLTRSYRTEEPLRIVGEVTDWARQTPEELQEWRDRLSKPRGDIIN